MAKTKIEWADEVLNFMVGCTRISDGCDHCYAIKEARMQEVRWSSPKYTGLTVLNNGIVDWTGELRIYPDLVEKPLHWRRPRKIFVNSMSDLFHESIFTFSNLALLRGVERFFEVMLEAKHHEYQILTKRPHLMRNFVVEFLARRNMDELPKHIWLGTSVENQKVADTRIPKLLQIPGSTKWLSMEPLLGEVFLGKSLWAQNSRKMEEKINWVVVGGESGTNARKMELVWAQKIIQSCFVAGVPVFMKQLGSVQAKELKLEHSKGGDIKDFPEYLQKRQYPL